MMQFLLLIICYLLGSIPFGLIVGRLWRVDIREYGSGNIGATNVLRTLGILPGTLVFTLDMLKGTASVILAAAFSDNPWLIVTCGLLAVLGHTYSIFLGFRGGKGVATGFGVLLGIAPEIFLFAVVLFIIIVAFTRYVSLGSILTSAAVLLAFWAFSKPLPYSLVATVVVLLIIKRHLANIKRLFEGKEPRLGEKR